MRQHPQAVDAGVGPEIHQHDLARTSAGCSGGVVNHWRAPNSAASGPDKAGAGAAWPVVVTPRTQGRLAAQDRDEMTFRTASLVAEDQLVGSPVAAAKPDGRRAGHDGRAEPLRGE